MKITEIDINILFLCQDGIKRDQLVPLLNTYNSLSDSTFHAHANKLIEQQWLGKVLLGYYTLYHTLTSMNEGYLGQLATTKNGIRILKNSRKLLNTEKKTIREYSQRKRVKAGENLFLICYSLGCFYTEALNIENQIKPYKLFLDNPYTHRIYKNKINSVIKTGINRLKRRNINSWTKARPYLERKLNIVQQSIRQIDQILFRPRLTQIFKRMRTNT